MGTLHLLPSLTDLATNPARTRELPPEAARDLLLQLAPLQEALRLQALGGTGNGSNSQGPPGGGTLLKVPDVARRLGISVDTVYSHRWPFEVRPTPGSRARRFSGEGLEKFILRRQER